MKAFAKYTLAFLVTVIVAALSTQAEDPVLAQGLPFYIIMWSFALLMKTSSHKDGQFANIVMGTTIFFSIIGFLTYQGVMDAGLFAMFAAVTPFFLFIYGLFALFMTGVRKTVKR